MRIALDGTPMALSSGGLRRYTAELASALRAEFPEDHIALLSGGQRNFFERRWWSWGVSRALARERADVFHGTNFEVPYLPIRPSVLTLHDLSPWMDPAWHSGADRVRRRTPLLIKLGIATMVIVPTRAVRRQAIEYFGLAPARVAAVPEGSTLRRSAVSPATPYFLYVGALEPRKNLEMLVEAWRGTGIELVLAGLGRPGYRAIEPEPGLRILGEVPEEELAPLYSGALAFLYPSLYEGFGLPVLEAMCCGAPVIASSDPAIAEVTGGAALLIDPGDGRAWAEALRFAASRPEWLADLREEGFRRAAEFSWARTARLTHRVYEEALARFA